MLDVKTQITAKVNKGIRDFSGIISKDLKPYEGKQIVFNIVSVSDIVVTEKPAQGVVMTETKKVN